MTGDRSEFEKALDNEFLSKQDADTDRYLAKPSIMISRGQLPGFSHKTRDAVPAILIMAMMKEGTSQDEIELVEMLRSSGVLFFVMCAFGSKTAIEAFAGGGENVWRVDDSPETFENLSEYHLRLVKNAFDRQLCVSDYERACFYEGVDVINCTAGWYTPRVPMTSGNCTAIVPPPASTTQSCESNNCSDVRDRLWPWSAPKSNCSGRINLTRSGHQRWSKLQFCPISWSCPTTAEQHPTTLSPASVAVRGSVVGWITVIVCAYVVAVASIAAAVLITLKPAISDRMFTALKLNRKGKNQGQKGQGVAGASQGIHERIGKSRCENENLKDGDLEHCQSQLEQKIGWLSRSKAVEEKMNQVIHECVSVRYWIARDHFYVFSTALVPVSVVFASGKTNLAKITTSLIINT